jgi:hypothetical protein
MGQQSYYEIRRKGIIQPARSNKKLNCFCKIIAAYFLIFKPGDLLITPGSVNFFGVSPVFAADANREEALNVGFTSPMNKVFFEKPIDFQGQMTEQTTIYLAKNEYEATQMVLFPQRDLKNVSVHISDLQADNGVGSIPSSDIEINPVGYVDLVWPEIGGNRRGWHPDPLLPNQDIDLKKGIPQPYLITVHTTERTKAGHYTGSIKISAAHTSSRDLKLHVLVWNFALPKTSKFKTASLMPWHKTWSLWPKKFGYNWPSWPERKKRFLKIADLGFKNRLPPVGYLANGLSSTNWKDKPNTSYGFPTHDKTKAGTKTFNSKRVDELIDYMLAKGANHFFIAMTSDIYKFPEAAPTRQATLLEYLREYTNHLRSRGLLHLAYVYNVDEPWGKAVQHAKNTFTLLKKEIGSDLKVMQNANQDNHRIIGDFIGYFDALDINLGFYDVNNAERYRNEFPGKLEDFWWNLNIWPKDRPNLFIEYPLIDARIIGPLSYKYGVQGFEYWDLFSRRGIHHYHPLASNELRVGWKINKGSLDGALIYPGQDLSIYSSMRFESFRDGMEDQEYLFLLAQLDPGNRLLAVPIIKGLKEYTEDTQEYMTYRQQIGETLDKLTTSRAN